MTTDPPVLGLVAGDGVYPEYIVRGARRRTPELRIVAVGFKGETNPAVISLCDAYQEFSVGQISKPFTFLKKHGVGTSSWPAASIQRTFFPSVRTSAPFPY